MKGMVLMPRLGETMEEGTLRAWLVKPGQAFKRGDVIAEVETDKTVVEMPALEAGTIAELLVAEGAVVPVGAPVARLVGAETIAAPSNAGAANATASAAPVNAPASAPSSGIAVADKVRASPAARAKAKARGLALSALTGTGARGRVQGWDVDAAGAGAAAGLALSSRGGGSKRPVLFLHGFGGDRESFLSLEIPLANSRRTLSVDLPGHGKAADHPASGFEPMADAVLAALDAAGEARVHLVAHSMGGGVAIALALKDPVRIASLTLIAPAGVGTIVNTKLLKRYAEARDETMVSLAIEQFVGPDSKLPRAIAAHIAAGRADPRRMAALERGLNGMIDGTRQRLLPVERLAEIAAPVRVIWGLDDKVLPADHADRLPGGIALHRFAGIGHMPQVEIPREVLKIVQAAIAGE
jgi:pyruvate dehydrogenase E2 component (dihydrolipoamide acetyltransferase)